MARAESSGASGLSVTVSQVSQRELERKAETAALLLEVARQLGESLDPDRIYRRFHELLANVVQHDGIIVSSYDEAERLIRCEYAWVGGNEIDPATLPPVAFNPSGGMQSRVIAEGTPLLENDVAERVKDPRATYYTVDHEGSVRRTPGAGPPGVKAAIMVPVKDEGRVVGVVQVMSDDTTYVPEHVEILEALAVQMAASVRNARLQVERRRLEAAEAAARAVAAEREQAATVLEAVGDGIFLCDDDGVVRLWNRAAEAVTGIRAHDVVGHRLHEVIPSWAALEEAIPVVGPGLSTRAVTLPVERDGRDLWLSFVAVHGAGGVVYAFRDVTNERRLEEEKSDFVATVSHELRTPTAAIFGAAETLLRRGAELDPGNARKLLEMIAEQAGRLGHIVEDILLTTKLDRGELAVDRAEVDLAELTTTTVDGMRPQLPASVSLSVEVMTDPAAASGDPDRIQQVLVNLVDNAVKYGGPSVTVRVAADERGARLSVSDAGPGIPLAEQQRVFEKFYRGDPQLTRNPAGTGLGLYISRELVRRMGGRLHVRSDAGAGATFVVELPRADAAR